MKLRVTYGVWNPLGILRIRLEIFLSLQQATTSHQTEFN